MTRRLIEELLREYPRTGAEARPEDSGARSGLRRPTISRGESFPYDCDDPDKMYGQPQDYDRGTKAHSGPLRSPLTPKGDNVWESIAEAMGGTTFFSKCDTSQLSSMVPGMSGFWANDPPRDWDEELDEAPLTIDTSPPDVEDVPNVDPENLHDQTDDDLERKIDRIWRRDDNPSFSDPMTATEMPSAISVVGSPAAFMQGIGMSLRPSRGRYGMIPKESVWRGLLESYGCEYGYWMDDGGKLYDVDPAGGHTGTALDILRGMSANVTGLFSPEDDLYTTDSKIYDEMFRRGFTRIKCTDGELDIEMRKESFTDREISSIRKLVKSGGFDECMIEVRSTSGNRFMGSVKFAQHSNLARVMSAVDRVISDYKKSGYDSKRTLTVA